MLNHSTKTDNLGSKYWKNDKGELHRLDGPAIEWANGRKDWFQDGQRHRLDGPAIEWADGSKWWYQDGQRHRLDGPAIEYSNGTKYLVSEWSITSDRWSGY